MASLVYLFSENRFDTLHPTQWFPIFPFDLTQSAHGKLPWNYHRNKIIDSKYVIRKCSILCPSFHSNKKEDENCCAAFSLAQQQFGSKGECTGKKIWYVYYGFWNCERWRVGVRESK